MFICFSFLLFSQTQTFTSSGTFTVPAGVTSIFVEAWGGGGAGGGAVGTSTLRAMGGGGGGGGFTSATVSVSPNDEINYIVASPTSTPSSAGPAVNGGSSSFLTVSANGGNGGQCVSALSAGTNIGGAGGAGGTGIFNGGNGGDRTSYPGGTTYTPGSGPGGGGAGDISNGGDASSTTTAAGVGGTASGGNGGTGRSSGGNAGTTGLVVGGGGSGAWAAASTTERAGGAGARGQIRITYTVLPIIIQSFNVSINNNLPKLKLSTASETNNDFFTIERSNDGRSFDAIGEIKGAGNSSREISYEFVDEKPETGINYYRIKQTDYDGKYSYSEIKSVRHRGLNSVSVSPSKTEGSINIVSDLEKYALSILNVSGQEIKLFKNLSLDQTISIDDLKSGLYFIKIFSGSETETIKIVKI